MKVYVVEGWFGDVEWRVSIHATIETANDRCAELWKTRADPNGPAYCSGLHKFAVEEVEVLP